MSFAQGSIVVLVLLTLLITIWASRQCNSTLQFYSAGRSVSGWQNGFALAGDYLSAAAFLGAAGLVVSHGYDSLIYAVGTLAGWPLLLLLLAEKLRERNCYTVADVLAQRFAQPSVRIMSACSSLLIVVFYLIVQMVGAGKLIELLFGVPYLVAVLALGVLMLVYVALGGMLATTWVQIIKAGLMVACALMLAFGVLRHTGFSLARLVSEAVAIHPTGAAVLLPSKALSNPWEVMSLGVGLTLGLLGLPHVLMRFFTVPDARAARTSACWATGIVALFFTLNVIIGAGAIVLVSKNPLFLDLHGKLRGGGNMAALHLAQAIGGIPLQGIVAAVVFATILAVVAGLTMAGASTLSHDLYASIWCRGHADERRELQVSRWATLGLALSAVLLSTLFQQQNIAILLGLAFAMAASGPFPVLLLTLFWPGLTARGAVAGGVVGLAGATIMIICGPAVWVAVLGHTHALFPLSNPALFSVSLAFFTAWAVSRFASGRDPHHGTR
jgi:cation/acetate symporter